MSTDKISLKERLLALVGVKCSIETKRKQRKREKMMKGAKQKIRRILFIILLLGLTVQSQAQSQDSKTQIQSVREASNAALKALDEELNMTYLTDDVFITAGSGTLINGKEELRKLLADMNESAQRYWVRTPGEIIVNEEQGLAWERGVWHGYDADDQAGEQVLFQGNYAAMWMKKEGAWKIKSQLFVTLN